MLYAVAELCTGVPQVRQTRGRFTMECCTFEDFELGTPLWPVRLPKDTNQPRTFELSFNLLSGVFGGTCEKYWPLKAINGLIIEIQLETPVDAFKYRFKPSTTDVGDAAYKKPTHDHSAGWYNGYTDKGTDAQEATAQGTAITTWNTYKSAQGLVNGANVDLRPEYKKTVWSPTLN